MSAIPLVIVKVGGSLLEWEELPQRLNAWLAGQEPGFYVLVAGAGPLGDFLRRADQQFQLGEERSHWLCACALSLSARLLSEILGDVQLLNSLESVRDARRGSLASAMRCVFDPQTFLRSDESRADGSELPHTWDVTTDSIAARLAECLNADKLMLLKSCDPPPLATFEEASRSGYVDRYFPRAAHGELRVVGVNFRGGGQMVTLRHANYCQ